MKVTIYGSGCAKCKQTEEIVRRVVAELGAAAEVAKVGEMREIAQAGVMSTPAVAVDGVVKLAGRVPTVEEVRGWLQG
jgi:small redox-active disulfide protein 2